jgi:tetratricopeptide (TPR) repeat protein
MDTSAASIAVSFALSGKWNEAIDANLEIVKSNPEDTEALCRLARAYAEIGKISDAREALNKVIKIDPINQIATKFLEKLKLAKNYGGATSSPTCNESFLEEPGKTKLIRLLNPGESENLVNLDPGEELNLTAYAHRVSVTTLDGKYVGRLPDDIAARLRNLIKEGNKYQVLIKCVTPKEITVFIRETEKGPGTNGAPSFPPEKIEYVSFTPPELVHSDTPSVETTEEIPEE